MIELVGVLHVHSTASDGSASPEEIILTAREAGLDFVGINDHCSLQVRDEGYGGWHDRMLLLAGAELNDGAGINHLLAYGIDSVPDTANTTEQITGIHAGGGIAIAAHPFEIGGSLPLMGAYRWTSGAPSGLGGVEVWNYMSRWKMGIRMRNLRRRLRDPDRYVGGPDPDAIELWRKVGGCAIGCPDAHAFRYGRGRLGLEVFPYRMLFDRLRTHLLLDELSSNGGEAERQVIGALGRGSVFTSNHVLGDARGFRAVLEGPDLVLDLPGPGQVDAVGTDTAHYGILEKGRHRLKAPGQPPLFVTVERKGRTWIACGLCSSS